MNSGLARRALAHLDAWTWLVAEYRTWLIVIATVIGMAAPLLSAARKHRPGRRLPWSSAAPPWPWGFPRPR